MLEIIPLKPETMARISEITGESEEELTFKYERALADNNVVMYSVQTWHVRRKLDE